MLLAIDIGNSAISVGVFDLSEKNAPILITHFTITARNSSADEFTFLLKDFLSRSQIYDASFAADSSRVIDAAVISSVVPNLTNSLYQAAEKICGKPPFMIANGVRTGFGIQIKNPEQLGSDIVSNVCAALERAPGPLVVLDMGTATTITLVDKNLTILGTVITPGLRISLDALYDSAAQLSDIVLDRNISLIGKDTKSSICSGIINGNAFMVDGFVRNIREELATKESGEKLSLIATGGHAPLVLPYLRNKFMYVETLTLEGLAHLYLKNHKIG